ncbi:MAG: 1,4-alpha-glucan branching protein GlgB [Candidatus Omnitrophica bacterium]|nr:1,4-alpha-glucan branching protein GlgB [Candidatus Omnitrophota bacterium]
MKKKNGAGRHGGRNAIPRFSLGQITEKTTPPHPGVSHVYHDFSLFTEQDTYLYKEGSHFRLYDKLGSHVTARHGVPGTYFAVMAPNAHKVYVMGDFNGWNKHSHPLAARWDGSGIWEGFIPGVSKGALYKFFIESSQNGYQVDKRDPFAFYCEVPPRSGSIVWDLDYSWNDQDWMANRHERNNLNAPFSIYELHFGSWRRKFEENRMYLIDRLHQNGIGVIFDWVPSHFPSDEYGLAYFDGTHLFEHDDPRKGFHPDWSSYVYNYGRRETINFLISSALFWFDKYHIDGIRVDAVASMIYLDYSRKEGEWIPNEFGGRENLEAIEFIKRLNAVVYTAYPDVQMIAEESTAWPMVSRPTYAGGLGFGMKWNMGWMHDTLEYFKKDPVHRKYHHNDLTFSMIYAFTENFMLSLSHDEVVHGKGSLLRKMPGNDWQKYANLRALYTYMYGHPGKKLLFMGDEIAQWDEWNHDSSIDWHLLQYGPHRGMQRLVKDLNRVYKAEPALYANDFQQDGFEWIDCNDGQNSVLSFLRKGQNPADNIVVVCNFTPVIRYDYKVGVPQGGFWKEIFNSDAKEYDGSGAGNCGGAHAWDTGWHGRPACLSLTLPPLGVLFLKKV